MSSRNYHLSHHRVKFCDSPQVVTDTDFGTTQFTRVEKVNSTQCNDNPHFPNLQMMFKNQSKIGAEEKVHVETIEHFEEKKVVSNKNGYVKEEKKVDVDCEAGEFIKRRHESYKLQRLMSMQS